MKTIDMNGLMLRDAQRLRRRADEAAKLRDPAARARAEAKLAADVDKAEARVAQRRASVPAITYPGDLPVSARREDLLEAIRDNQVVIVAGETGSGKTTQIPKLCLELGRGVTGLIGHTQPRRLAARTVAARIADELGVELGSTVGYKMRFTDQVGSDTLVKLMTDGILLAEIQSDRNLRQYDTLIIDEAHERSLNVDFLLGYVKQLLPRRPDLKVIITSATIDPERFSRHFGDAPIVEVSGRTYPVEVRYRPQDDEDGDQNQAILTAVDELTREGRGDVLVFLSGEREIRDAADALRAAKLPHTEILPLYARLASAEQHRVFSPHTGRRIVLATNVAETSLTVPGIKYVVDTGTARISRYSARTKVQRLPIEPVSRASADQRKGRCGRTSAGICVRLYSEEDFLGRPEFTDPEILRTNLASVILQMTAAGLGEIEAFPFVEPPDRRNIADGVALLHELDALEPDDSGGAKRLTKLGTRLAQLPVDPRLGRMILAAERGNCVREVLVITAALSIQDPRERPAEKREQATQAHARFREKDPKALASDFSAWLNLWDYLRELQRELSGNQFRKRCKAEYLHYLRIREWQDLYAQLRQVTRQMGIHLNEHPADRAQVHRALLAGLLSHIGMKDGDKHEYFGARGAKFAIFPGSSLFKKQPKFVMAAELVETSRLWGREVARIEPEWAESLADHLVKRQYSEPHWSRKQGAVVATERVTLYGVPIVAGRTIQYARVDPVAARELFIRSALVEGDWETSHDFFAANRRLLDEVEELEERVRRRDIKVDDQTLFDFYDERIPASVVSARHFDSWWKKERGKRPELLDFEQSMLMHDRGLGDVEAAYPDTWTQDGHELALTYQFEPGDEADGVTVHVPLAVLNQIGPDGFEWLVPGFRLELVTAMIRSLPKQVRRNFSPAPNYAERVMERLGPAGMAMPPPDEPLAAALERELRALGGVEVRRDEWNPEKLPDHLRPTFRVRDGKRGTVGEGKDLAVLKAKLVPKLRKAISAAAEPAAIERAGLRNWDGIGELPRTFEGRHRARTVLAYPALVDEGESVAVRLLESPAAQAQAMVTGTRALLVANLPSPMKLLLGRLPNRVKMTLSRYRHGSPRELFDDAVAAAVDELVERAGGPAWDEHGFERLLRDVRMGLPEAAYAVMVKVERVLAVSFEVEARLAELAPAGAVLQPSLDDVRVQLDELIHPGFVATTGAARLDDLLRYVQAMARRLEKLPEDPGRDELLMLKVADMWAAWREVRDRQPPGDAGADARAELDRIAWMIEELRVSYFAQALGTPYTVSDKRIVKALRKVES
jgi:ATP-dependent helicase HrpA